MPNKSPKRSREKQTKTAQPAQIYELKIMLRGSKPPIWRRIAVAADMRLSDLHQVIQVVMGWGNYHLHQFVVRDRCWSDQRMEVEGAEDERKMRLCELSPAVKSKFIYEYDFGDDWEHEIEVVKIGPPADNVKYPVCLAGKLACPPEDCGGVWGYYEKLEVLKNPKHKDYEELIEWMGKKFDPERFDLEKINAALANLR